MTTPTLVELRRGIERLPARKRKSRLNAWLQSLCECMKGRVLSVNTSTARVWGRLKAKWDAFGTAISSLNQPRKRPTVFAPGDRKDR